MSVAERMFSQNVLLKADDSVNITLNHLILNVKYWQRINPMDEWSLVAINMYHRYQ